MQELLKKIEKQVEKEFRKEYLCHLKIVQKIAIDLQQRFGGDLDVIKIASISHDIGRVEGGDNKMHAERGALRIREWLKAANLPSDAIEKISRCALMHNKVSDFQSIEEKIVSNADMLSKLVGHQQFMLMCKKDNYIDKAKWGLKYVEKAYFKLTIPELTEERRQLYEDLKRNYEDILNH